MVGPGVSRTVVVSTDLDLTTLEPRFFTEFCIDRKKVDDKFEFELGIGIFFSDRHYL